MNFYVMTLFPELIENVAKESILGRAVNAGYISVKAVNFRAYSKDRHRHVDDYTYGGGAGMLIKPEPVYDCYADIAEKIGHPCRVVYLTPAGRVFTQETAQELAKEEDLILLCGHYEGIDERVIDEIVTDQISIGDYVLTGGELPAMVIVDAVARMLPNVLGSAESAATDSFFDGMLGYPQYTRPREFEGKFVPEILLSGNHADIKKWREEQALALTRTRRPDLIK